MFPSAFEDPDFKRKYAITWSIISIKNEKEYYKRNTQGARRTVQDINIGGKEL